MIVKVQLPISGNEPGPPKMLVYNQDRSVELLMPVSDRMAVELRQFPYKGYFQAYWEKGKANALVFGKRVPDASW
jgi:hypothetical protein